MVEQLVAGAVFAIYFTLPLVALAAASGGLAAPAEPRRHTDRPAST